MDQLLRKWTLSQKKPGQMQMQKKYFLRFYVCNSSDLMKIIFFIESKETKKNWTL